MVRYRTCKTCSEVGRQKHRWEDNNIQMDLKERGHEDIDMGSGQDPVAGSCET
jgi:hypothetical protein